MSRGHWAALTAWTVIASVGCGGDEPAADSELTVSAASSLTGAFEAYGEETPDVEERFEFAGSDDLAAQIRQGAAPDVYAAANTDLPEALAEEGLVGEPTVFATNALVIGVPAGSDIDSIDDLAQPGTDLIIGTQDVPFGSYARTVLSRLPPAQEEAILGNVRSEESDVKAAVGKLAQGAADASFVYTSDVDASGGEIEAVELAPDLQPDVAYGVAVAEEAENPEEAQEFIDGLESGAGAEALEAAGFKPPPKA